MHEFIQHILIKFRIYSLHYYLPGEFNFTVDIINYVCFEMIKSNFTGLLIKESLYKILVCNAGSRLK
jgi:hypothetical protein